MVTQKKQSISIIDSTLREGLQSPGVRFGIEESCEIARFIKSIGVNAIECGHPQAGEHELKRVRSVVKACGDFPVLAHARARVEDIECVASTGAQWVGIFIGVNSISKTCRISSQEESHIIIQRAVSHAKKLGLSVRFTIEDGSRTCWDDLVDAYRFALDAGAERLCFADTVGLLCTWETEELVKRLCKEFTESDIEVHFHDDRGMANANALIATKAGASWLSSSINGIGERCGITDTINLMVNLDALGWRKHNTNGCLLQQASVLVQAHSRLYVDRWRPVVGHNASTHVAKLHQRAVMIDQNAYSWINPECIGRVSSTSPASLSTDSEKLINTPVIISATELRHHRHGPGDRYLMLDDRVVSDARQYCIVRHIPLMEEYGSGHVDVHRHRVDSIFLFLGHGENLTGLSVEVLLGKRTFTVNSPSSVFIPSGVLHSYRVVSGSGIFVNHVQAGDYNSSLLDITQNAMAYAHTP